MLARKKINKVVRCKIFERKLISFIKMTNVKVEKRVAAIPALEKVRKRATICKIVSTLKTNLQNIFFLVQKNKLPRIEVIKKLDKTFGCENDPYARKSLMLSVLK